VLGGEVRIPTISGKEVKIKVPHGTQSNHTFRLRGEGLPILNRNGKGDLYVKVFIIVPKNINAKARKIITELAELNPSSGLPQLLPASDY